MAPPRRFDADAAKLPQKPGEQSDKANNFSSEQLETWLQLFPEDEISQRESAWGPWKTIAFVVIASALLWLFILFAAFQFL